MAARHEQIGQCAGDDEAMCVLFEPAIADLGKAEHPLDDPDCRFDPRPHFRLGTIFRPLRLLHRRVRQIEPLLQTHRNLSGQVTRMEASGSGHWGLLLTHITDFGSDPKFLGPRSSMLCSSDVIAAEVEEVIDLIVG
jgi:hypothetical protein